ncbi:MAG TPA: hypothetical protein VLO11_09770, partial [Luteolibacter sp.]|nr:hypothetical protein [Luteolibacter sp.]
MRKVYCYMALLLSGILPLAAQSGSGGDRRAGGGRSAWFACIDIPEGLENPVKVMGGNQLTELELPKFMASAPVDIPADGILRIVREAADAGSPDKPEYQVLAEAKIPNGVREALVILAPIAKPEGDLLFRSKVQDLADFKGGDRLYINLSTTQIRVRLGKTTVAVAPGQTNIFESPALAKPANVPIMYEFYHPERNEWKILSASTVVLRPTRREICVFNSGTRIGNIKKHGILFPVRMPD